LPIPADVAALWRRARDEGVALGALHVLDTPMHPDIAGQHNRESGDIWVLHDPDDPDRTVARLIHELAHAARRAVSIPETIEGYYRDEVATQRLARRLARRWGVGDLFPEEVVAAYLLLMRRRRMELPLAGDLAGSHRLGVATAALDDLLRMRHTFGWDDDAWDGVLWGDAAEADDPATRAIAGINRCTLRHRWGLGWGYGEGFDTLDAPPTPSAARLVRATLVEAAERGASIARVNTRRRRGRDGVARRVGRLPLWDARDARFPGRGQRGPPRPPRVGGPGPLGAWGGDPVRSYKLDVSYHAPIGEKPGEGGPPSPWRLWADVLGRCDEIEPALHLYIRGWKRATSLRRDTLRAGLEEVAMRESTLAW
jgi:hypothetical protein